MAHRVMKTSRWGHMSRSCTLHVIHCCSVNKTPPAVHINLALMEFQDTRSRIVSVQQLQLLTLTLLQPLL